MSEYLHLIGAEDVQRAGRAMAEAAQSIERSAGYLRDTMERHAARIEEATARAEAPASLAAGAAPAMLTVILADTHATLCAIEHEGESRPYRRRTVQIALTEEQRASLAPRKVGEWRGKDAHEEIVGVWLEPTQQK